MFFLSSRFGTAGIVYQLSGNGAELFNVDNRSGVITVAPCATPGQPPCMDFETRKDYFLQYKVGINICLISRYSLYYVISLRLLRSAGAVAMICTRMSKEKCLKVKMPKCNP